MSDQELEAFKSGIDLRAYAAGMGYALDRKESWRGSSVMRHPDGDKIVIKRDADGHYVYFSVRDDGDNGSIIDFAKRRLKLSLGGVRKELRPHLGNAAAALPPYPDLPKIARDQIRVERQYARTEAARRHAYLEEARAIPAAMLESPRFAGRIRIDGRGNAIFPHFDADGLCGFEIKNRGFTGFASGGVKGIWISESFPGDNRIVFCESAIDALSHAVLFPDARARYASIGGQVNPAQPLVMRAAIAVMPANATVVAAMDADAQGRKLAEIVREAARLACRADLNFLLHEPAGFKDWNDELRGQRLPCIPARPPVLEAG